MKNNLQFANKETKFVGMKTNGHIITDEQLREYEKLKKRFAECKFEISFFKASSLGNNDFYINTVPLYNIVVSGVDGEEFSKVIETFDELSEISVQRSRIATGFMEHQCVNLDEKLERIRKEIAHLEEKRTALLESPSIIDFIKKLWKQRET